MRKYQKFHAFRKLLQKTSWEAQIKDKGKIEGAYLLLKRFKNRLKQFDHGLEKINEKKVDKAELSILSDKLDPMKIQTVFTDMRILLDQSMATLSKKHEKDLHKMMDRYEGLIKEEKLFMQTLESKYAQVMMNRLDKI